MKINELISDIKFTQLKAGDVFKYKGAYFIKLRPVMENGVYINAATLHNGALESFVCTDEVELVECELVVK